MRSTSSAAVCILATRKIFNDRTRFAVGRVTALLGMNGFEHVAHLADPGCRHMAEDIPVKMNHAALPLSIRQKFRSTLHQASAGVGDDELHAGKAAVDQVAQEHRPARLVLLGAAGLSEFLCEAGYPS